MMKILCSGICLWLSVVFAGALADDYIILSKYRSAGAYTCGASPAETDTSGCAVD